MARFLYSMEKILNIKYKLESQAKADFAENIKKLQEEEFRLKDIFDDIELYVDNLREKSMDLLNINDIKWTRDAIENKKEQAKRQQVMVNIASKNLEISRRKLKSAITERKTHEKLKEKQFEEFVLELNKQELKEVDEIVNYKYSNAGR